MRCASRSPLPPVDRPCTCRGLRANGRPHLQPAWGSLLERLSRVRFLRFTPTRVGRPCFTYRRVDEQAVHPHPRGEAGTWLERSACGTGSPPPAWGSRQPVFAGLDAGRFTPTRVGKPFGVGLRTICVSVHPHPRGEAGVRAGVRHARLGSPPPAWGSREGVGVVIGSLRFTPTRVGKPAPTGSPTTLSSVHPHPRGEAQKVPNSLRGYNGSPPPAWGSPMQCA